MPAPEGAWKFVCLRRGTMNHEVRVAGIAKIAVSILMSGLLASTLFGQKTEPAKVRPSRDPDKPKTESMERGRETDNPLARQQWFMHGRTVPHGSAAEY